MNIQKGNLHLDKLRDAYWSRILIKSPDESLQTFVFICASFEYLRDNFKSKNFNEKMLTKWLDIVSKEWTKKGNGIFNKSHHIDARTVSDDGYKNVIGFLNREVIPQP